jgi:hypothetical protein
MVLPSRHVLSKLVRSDDNYHYASTPENAVKWAEMIGECIALCNAVQLPRGFHVCTGLPAPGDFPIPDALKKSLRNFRISAGIVSQDEIAQEGLAALQSSSAGPAGTTAPPGKVMIEVSGSAGASISPMDVDTKSAESSTGPAGAASSAIDPSSVGPAGNPAAVQA